MAAQRAKAEKLAPPAGPGVDELNMRYFGSDEHSVGEVIDFTQYRSQLEQGTSAKVAPKTVAPPQVELDANLRPLRKEPKCDIGAASTRLKVLSPRKLKPTFVDFIASVSAHALVITGLIGFPILMNTTRSIDIDQEPIEVSFGLSDVPTRSVKDLPETPQDPSPESPPEALKAPEQLPQLPKNVAMDAPPKEDPKQMPAPDEPKPTPAKTQAPTPPPAQVETPPPNVKKLTQEEMMRRLERENRKVGEKEQEGVKNKKSDKTNTKPVASDIPKSPFDSSIPDAPPGLAPAGDIGGRVDATVKNQYTTAAIKHLKQFWTLPETSNFTSDLKVQLVFRINIFGRIVGDVEIEKSSGNPEFDEEAVAAVKNSVPFPDLPAELEPEVRIHPILRPRDAKK